MDGGKPQSPDPALIEVGVSRGRNAQSAAREAAAQIDVARACFVQAFVPAHLAGPGLAEALAAVLPGVPVFGCTTAGQITPRGYEDDALLLIAFSRRHFRCASLLLSPLAPLSIEAVATSARRLAASFSHTAGWSRLALLFCDGLSKQEDILAAALEAGLDDVPVFGGSAADALEFSRTFVLHGGVFHPSAGLVLLLETDLEFAGIGFDHFVSTEKRMVVTRAIPEERLVLELNGAPAAAEYARLVGCAPSDLSPQVFAENPVLVRSRTVWHVRAIQGVAADGGLAFLSAIDDGLILTLGRSTEILRRLDQGLGGAPGAQARFILGFDCYLRKLEIEQKDLREAVSERLRAHNVLGFNTYGEQHLGVHVNQTFVGVAFHGPRRTGLE
ncbi:FIST C domain containing protein [Profundibacterium mesophilum KAUST100406-0324]|uniref:FIST C domain containing protein n=2 Tax=Profundibacterium TaxID=1258570 RepID=A0A921TC54_9RHOB|nr:FIST C domain containing protein [Profundibacterium mesophilum KAUST100406-0324]